MDERTLAALKGSIEKWEKIVAGTGLDKGPDNCPLCQLFYQDDCRGCPVYDFTGQIWCRGSPNEWYSQTEDGSAAEKSAAQAELDFLRSLLPDATS